MGNYAVPEEIRKMRPAGTTVKNIKGHFYVYEYTPTSVNLYFLKILTLNRCLYLLNG